VSSPFHRFGVKVRTKHEYKRERRISPAEEKQLLAAANQMNSPEHGFAGGPMRDRIVAALDTGCRLGEMLKIQNKHVLWDTHQICIPAAHTKDAESRRIPFEPRGRLSRLLSRRRFLGSDAYVFGGAAGEYHATIRTAWETLVLIAHGADTKRPASRGRV
jgi:integrase